MGPILLLIFGIAFCWALRDWSPLCDARGWAACVLGLGAGLSWYVLVYLRLTAQGGPTLAGAAFGNWDAILAGTGLDTRPVWHYFQRSWTDLAPWIYFVPVLVAGYMRYRRKLPMTPQVHGLTWGGVAGLIYLSILPYKQFQAITPLCPVMALTVARGLYLAGNDRRLHVAFDVLGVVIVLWGLSSFAVLRSIFFVSDRWLLLQTIFLVAGGSGMLCLAAERRQRPRAVILAMTSALVIPILFGQIVPAAKTDGQELMAIGNEIGRLIPAGGQLVSVAPEPEPLFAFGGRHTIRNVRSWDDLAAAAATLQPAGRLYVLAREDVVGRPPLDDAERVQTWRLQHGVLWRLWKR